uniref:UNC93-like protein MFSD11 n=1 Tax=Plectus sambesii TaxID=2011161 RepID=A0A914UYK4_9BILA
MDTKTLSVVQLGLSFFFIFAAFNTQGFIEETAVSAASKTNSAVDKDSGYYSLSIIYAVNMAAMFLAPSIIGFIGPKWSMVFGSSLYCVFLAGFQYLRSWLIYLTSATLGFGASMLWTGQGNYLTLCSTKETVGRNSGILWAMNQTCLISGGIFLYAMFHSKVDKDVSEEEVHVLYLCFLAVCAAGVICLALLRQPKPVTTYKAHMDSKLPAHKVNEAYKGSESDISSTETGDRTHSESQVSVSEEVPVPCMESFVGTFKLLGTRNMMLLAPVFFFMGISMSFWTGIYSTCLSRTNQLAENPNTRVAFNAMALGVGQIFGGGAFGLLGHRTNIFGRTPIILLGAVTHLITYSLVFINLPGESPLRETDETSFLKTPSNALAIVCGLMLGFADSCWNTQIYSILASMYKKNSAQAFALFRFFMITLGPTSVKLSL